MSEKETGTAKKRDIYDVRNIIIVAIAICFIGGIIGMWFVPPLKWWLGTMFGFLINLFCFRLLYLECEKNFGRSKRQAKFSATSNYVIRYIIKGAALYASIKSEYLSMGSCVLGLLSINAAIHILNILNMFLAKSKEKE